MTEKVGLGTHVVARCDAARFARLETAALARAARAGGGATLVVAGLTGDTVLIGRHQHATAALRLAEVRAAGVNVARRLGGGRALRVGDGVIGVCLALPHAGALFGGGMGFGADRVINRYVRGLLAALRTETAAHGGAHYFGRDHVVAAEHRVATVSQDGTPGGAVLFEAWIAAGRAELDVPGEWTAYPAHGDPRAAGAPWTPLVALAGEGATAPSAEEMADRCARAWSVATDAEIVSLPANELERGDPPDPEIDEPGETDEVGGWRGSGVADVPIGFAQAFVRLAGDGRIAAARLRGDFVAPAFAVRAAEAALVGCAPKWLEIAAALEKFAELPGATILGADLRVLAEAAFVAAGGAEGK